jgi:hypothetical protein
MCFLGVSFVNISLFREEETKISPDGACFAQEKGAVAKDYKQIMSSLHSPNLFISQYATIARKHHHKNPNVTHTSRNNKHKQEVQLSNQT